MQSRYLYFISLLFAPVLASTQPRTDRLLQDLFSQHGGKVIQQITGAPQQYRVQIIYTEINRDRKNRPSFRNYYFNYDPNLYFNPASMVKMPLAFLSLEKLNAINKKGVDKFTTVVFDSSRAWHRPMYADSSAASGVPSIAHFIKRSFLISENDPYNRMYQFIGQAEINRNLHGKGYTEVRITRQFLGLTEQQNRITNPVRFLNKKRKTLFSQPEQINTDSFDFSKPVRIGKAFMNRNDSLINEPFDFTKQNNISLLSLQQMLRSVLFPSSVPEKQRFKLKKDDYHFLYQYLSQYPSETPDPKYDSSVFYDSYVKFFFRDSTGRMPPFIRVFNKVGWSYGFLTDVSYVADFRNNIEYMLAATVYVNSDEILNDNKYEYQELGHPFLYELGQCIYQHELNRKRENIPDLSRFKTSYDKRNPKDARPSLKEVDN